MRRDYICLTAQCVRLERPLSSTYFFLAMPLCKGSILAWNAVNIAHQERIRTGG